MALKIGSRFYKEYNDLISAVQKLPSPLVVPKGDLLWNDITHPCWKKVNKFIKNVPEDLDSLLKLLSSQKKLKKWINIYYLCGIVYKKTKMGEFKMSLKKTDEIFSLSTLAYQRLQADYIEEAICIEQREYGSSKKNPIGTHNLQDCLGIFFWDKEIKTMTFAHLDNLTIIDSIDYALKDFHKSNEIICTLIGSRFNEDPKNNLSVSSMDNLIQTLNYLKDKNINIIQAEVGRSVKLLATAVVGDPLSGKIYRAFPKHRKYRDIVTALAWRGEFGSSGSERISPLSPGCREKECKESIKRRLLNGELPLDSNIGEHSLYSYFVKEVQEDGEFELSSRRLPVVINMYNNALKEKAIFEKKC